MGDIDAALAFIGIYYDRSRSVPDTGSYPYNFIASRHTWHVAATRVEKRFYEHDQLLELQAKGGREIVEASDRVVEAMNESRIGLDALRRDVVRLADDVRGEVGMSRAIELARGGATKQAVADATGLSLEEAEAIVTFHGRK